MVRSSASCWIHSRIVALGAACWWRMNNATQNGDEVIQIQKTVYFIQANSLYAAVYSRASSSRWRIRDMAMLSMTDIFSSPSTTVV